MNAYWKKLTIEASLWLLTEAALSLVGLDNIADYTEFVSSKYNSFTSRLSESQTILNLSEIAARSLN
jgi:hypothetical protein